ncbi:hypothetical protein HY992_06785 [Candidatus Micrarchaeota archaeon]|nr:hypothetical protein [Candidatus Micrarchaeota archaeon]
MVLFPSTTLGSFPRSNSVISSINDCKHEAITLQQLEENFSSATREVLLAQQNAGITFPTDGQISWDDLLSPFASKISGMKLGGLIRFFDNNFYYRKPEATSELRAPEQPVAVAYYNKAKATSAAVRPVLPGPFTFADLSTNSFYKSKQEFVSALAGILAREANALEQAGAKVIQIDEPSLVFASISSDDLQLAKQAIETIAKATNAELFLSTYFGSAEKILPALLDFKTSLIGIDCTFPSNVKAVEEIDFTKKLCLGVLDARTTKKDSKKEVFEKIKRAGKSVSPEKLGVSPSACLGLLPYVKAIEKTNALGEITKELRESTV